MSADPGPLPETVIVVGASGFIGRNLVRHLKGQVGRILPVSLAGGEVEGIAGLRFAELDRADVGRDTAVVNLAAHRYDAASFAAGQSDIFLRNLEIAARVYEFCARREITEVRSASSIAVYPEGDTVCDDSAPLDLAADPADGELMYGWSKRVGEIAARLFARKCGVHTVAFRLSSPYGPYDSLDPAKAHVVPAFVMRALTTTGPFTVRGDPGASRDFVYVGDVCEIFRRSLAWRGRDEVYNLGSGENVTIGELARHILALVGGDREIVAAGAPVSAVAHRRCPSERLRAAFAVERFTPLGDGLKPTIAWYRDAYAART